MHASRHPTLENAHIKIEIHFYLNEIHYEKMKGIQGFLIPRRQTAVLRVNAQSADMRLNNVPFQPALSFGCKTCQDTCHALHHYLPLCMHIHIYIALWLLFMYIVLGFCTVCLCLSILCCFVIVCK